MADRNDFKVVANSSLSYFNALVKEFNIPVDSQMKDSEKQRIGFYHLVISSITNETSAQVISDSIIDSKYNSFLKGNAPDDLGIDAVYVIEGDEHGKILLFNFKYRESYKQGSMQEESALSRCEKFLSYINPEEKLSSRITKMGKVYDKISDIREKLSSNTVWDIQLFMVSNESLPINNKDYISLLERKYELEVRCITLDDIAHFMYKRPKDQCCKFIASKNDFLQFNKDSGSTEISYVVKMNLIDVIRITCKKTELSLKYDIRDDKEVTDAELNDALLFDNVRGYLGETTYNQKIQKTLGDEPENFFIFNNGLTIVANSLEATSVNSNTSQLFELKDYQLVNGGQTLRSIYNFLKTKDKDRIEKLRSSFVLTRIFKVSEATGLQNRIAEYTNSQNAINAQDLKSVDSVQIKIETLLQENNIQYIRKAGVHTPDPEMYTLGMDTLAKIVYTNMGFPERVTTQKKKLFTKYYDEIFGSENLLETIVPLVKKYQEIVSFGVALTEQTTYYILHLILKNDITIEQARDFIKTALETYQTTTTSSDARKLIKKGFKEHLENTVEKELKKRNNKAGSSAKKTSRRTKK